MKKDPMKIKESICKRLSMENLVCCEFGCAANGGNWMEGTVASTAEPILVSSDCFSLTGDRKGKDEDIF